MQLEGRVQLNLKLPSDSESINPYNIYIFTVSLMLMLKISHKITHGDGEKENLLKCYTIDTIDMLYQSM